jgi:integrase
MEEMPRPRPPNLHHQRTRHGVWVWYVRKGKGPRIRIHGLYGTPEFMAAYQAAMTGGAPVKRGAVKSGSLNWLVARYRESSDWLALSPSTKRERENILKHVLASAGNEPFADIDKSTIIAGRERRMATPSAANNFMNTMRKLYEWAVDNDHVEVNPVEGVKRLKRPAGGFHPWTEGEVAAFEAKWPMGTRERLALAILLYTGLRRGDAAALGPGHVVDGVIVVKTEKTGIEVTIPMLPELAAAIDATKTGKESFIVSRTGGPMSKEGFGNWFKDACKAAGVPGSAHGLRKAGATRAANNGATVAQLEAIFGWRGGRMASKYTETADRIRLAKEAISKLQKRQPIPSPKKSEGRKPNNARISGATRPHGAGGGTRTPTTFVTGT